MTQQTPELRLAGDQGDEYAALAELFLDGEKREPSHPLTDAGPAPRLAGEPALADSETTQTLIEGIVVGHLPVMGSAWVREHARWLARTAGVPVALLRISGGHAALDVFADGESTTDHSTPDLEPTADLASGIERVRPHVRRWLVQTDAVAEPTLRKAPGIDSLSLLTGADEAAVVAAYRTIKNTVNDGRSDIRVVITGADAETASHAADRIRDASSSFLHAEVAIEHGSQQIGPGPSAAVFRGATDLSLGDAVSLMLEAVEAGDAAVQARIEPTADPDDELLLEPLSMPSKIVEPVTHPAVQPDPLAVAAVKSEPASPSEDRVDAKPVETHGSTDGPIAVDQPIPGATTVLKKCPLHARVSLLIDDAGQSHLLAEVRSARDADRALGELQAAQAWLRTHAGMLAELRGIEIQPEAELHIVTNDPAFTRHLLEADAHIRLRVPPSDTARHIALN